jgi:hypothetical protein
MKKFNQHQMYLLVIKNTSVKNAKAYEHLLSFIL